MKGLGRDAVADQCMEMKALKALVELCHLHGLAVNPGRGLQPCRR